MSAIFFKAAAVSPVLVTTVAGHAAARADFGCVSAGVIREYHTKVGQQVVVVVSERCVTPGHGLRNLRFV